MVGIDNEGELHGSWRALIDAAAGEGMETDGQVKQNKDEPRPNYSLRAANDLLASLGIPPRGPGSIDLVMDATGAEVCIQMGINAVRPG